MGNRIAGFLVMFFILLMAAPQELAAQDFFPRLFRTGKYRHYNCNTEAYNQRAAYRKHKRGRGKKMTARLISKPADGERITKAGPPPAKTKQPPNKTTSSTPKPGGPGRKPPVKKPEEQQPEPGTETPPLLAKVPPAKPKQADSAVVVKRNVTHLTREALRKMTLQERRDTLERTQPTIVLPPIQFISDQDEFSVVNMDSFMQAMEYAQQGKVVLIEGHTDDLGSDAYNLKLSMKRAEKIRQLLLSGDVSDELISVIGYGESQPVVPNTSTENRAINRRIEFKIFSVGE